MRRAILLLALACAACQASSARYVGSVSGCGPASRGLLEISGHSLVFSPSEGVLTLHGSAAADGSLTAQAAATTQGAPTYRFTGRLENNTVTGTLDNGTCAAKVDLAPATSGLQRSLPDRSPLQSIL